MINIDIEPTVRILFSNMKGVHIETDPELTLSHGLEVVVEVMPDDQYMVLIFSERVSDIEILVDHHKWLVVSELELACEIGALGDIVTCTTVCDGSPYVVSGERSIAINDTTARYERISKLLLEEGDNPVPLSMKNYAHRHPLYKHMDIQFIRSKNMEDSKVNVADKTQRILGITLKDISPEGKLTKGKSAEFAKGAYNHINLEGRILKGITVIDVISEDRSVDVYIPKIVENGIPSIKIHNDEWEIRNERY